MDRISDVCIDHGPQNDPVRVLLGLVTHAQAKFLKKSLQGLVQTVQDQHGVHRDIEGLEGDKQNIYTMIQAHGESSGPPSDWAELGL
ncbi:unnamed protein product [Coffea canephora]|uniref:DH200=94 genomic scaffold, scaffold_1225 n=1 Tax=Coffea canephora TaxID=49390 RepID=A0A068UEU4_COFCA|nr:unnamed protein product [Coffea canephora]CDP20462.1 unnamed protein product [Coffea canephora]